MALKLFNTATRRKEETELGKEVKLYFCGPTVYDYAHIGNLRAYVFADILHRWVARDRKVKFVMNITDVDDKTIRNSQEAEVPLKEYTRRYENEFMRDIHQLRIRDAKFVRATDNIEEMAELVRKLIDRGHAYVARDGIYYDISSFNRYGKMARVTAKKKARISEDEYDKDEAGDFVLWKFWKPGDGDVFWEIDFGSGKVKGRPGWHIECSVLSTRYLGDTIDIHGGGTDLVFPHHTNEIAQTEPVTGKPLARYWVHNEHLLVDGKKMSKSLGNFYTLRDLEKRAPTVAFRYMCLAAHYRKQMNFTFAALEDAAGAVKRLNDFIFRIKNMPASGEKNKLIPDFVEESREKFVRCMDDDINTPKALSVIFDVVSYVNKQIDKGDADVESLEKTYEFMKEADQVLALITESERELTDYEKELIRKREKLRRGKKYDEADKIRKELKEHGVHLEDTPDGVVVRFGE